MRILRGLGGALLWLVASVVGLVAVILCVTILLLPVGLPLLRVARKMFGRSARLMLPAALAHPVKSAKDSLSDAGSEVSSGVSDAAEKAKPRSSKPPWRRRKSLVPG